MAASANIVVVDDDESTANAYEDHLSRYHTVEAVYSGEAALEVISDATDIVLLDRRMPGIDGDEVLAQIREQGIDCRVIMVTGVEPDTDLIDMKFDEYLVKPVNVEEIEAAVDRMLTRNKQDEQFREMFALASKLTTLETKLDQEQLEESEEYATLREEFLEYQREVGFPEDEADPYLESMLEKIEALVAEAKYSGSS